MIDTIFRTDLMRNVQPDLTLCSFDRLPAWQDWASRHLWINNADYIASFPDHARDHGVRSLWYGATQARDVSIHGDPPQVEIRIQGMPQWPRALLDLMAAMHLTADAYAARIYAAEALSPWALALRGRYPRFIGSEYLPEAGGAATLYPVQHQDLENLNHPTGAFDVALCREVLEHVADISAALRELARILRPGGVMLATFPFLWGAEKGVHKARLHNGQVQHLVEPPEYHSDPLRPGGGLVFYLPGWEVLDMARRSGFSRAEFLLYSSKTGGIVNPHLAGIWIMLGMR